MDDLLFYFGVQKNDCGNLARESICKITKTK